MDIVGFAYALWADWVGLMSGIASLVTTTAGFFQSDKRRKWFFYVVAALCFVLASVRIWTTEHRLAIAALFQPKLHMTVTLGGSGANPLQPTSSFVYAEVRVTNTGTQSALHTWKLRAQALDGQWVEGQTTIMEGEDLKLANEKGDTRPFPARERFLPEVTTNPIPTGGSSSGFMFSTFHVSPEFFTARPTTKMQLSCIDADNKEHVQEFDLRVGKMLEMNRRTPGVR